MRFDSLYVICLSFGLLLALGSVLTGRQRRLRRRGPRPRGKPGRLRGRISKVPPRLLMMLASLVLTLFGIAGLAARSWFTSGSWLPLAMAVAGAGAGLQIALLLGSRLLESQDSAGTRGQTLLGTNAHVSVAIPAGGIGQIAYVASGKRTAMPARAVDGSALPRATPVLLLAIEGHVAQVQATETVRKENRP